MDKKPIKIFLLEDNPEDVLLVKRLLVKARFILPDLEEVDSLSGAIGKLKSADFDIILSDLKVPDGQGADILNKLRENAPNLPIVVITGTYDDAFGVEAIRKGTQDFLIKDNLNPQFLEHSILYAIERKKIEDDLKKSIGKLETQAWGLKKTNEGVKLLYKELDNKNKKNKELKKFDQLKSNFISTVSHELRTPLAITKAGIDIILDRIPGDINEKQEEILSRSKFSIDRLARIISDLLDISKIEAGKVELKRKLFNLVDIIGHTALSFKEKVEEKGLELRIDISDEEISVFADPDKIIQILTNLIGNSLKFTDKGYIEVSVRQNLTEIECFIEDTGRGIEEVDQHKLFDKFEQFGRVASGGEKGTGLGLAITKKVVEMHGGVINAESKPGKGAKFTFTLPRYSFEEICKEYINNGIKGAVPKNSFVSIILLRADKMGKVKRRDEQKLSSILRESPDTLKKSLRGDNDAVITDDNKIVAIMPDCNREGAYKAAQRLDNVLTDMLVKEGLDNTAKSSFGIVTYPGDGNTADELINKLMEIRHGKEDTAS